MSVQCVSVKVMVQYLGAGQSGKLAPPFEGFVSNVIDVQDG